MYTYRYEGLVTAELQLIEATSNTCNLKLWNQNFQSRLDDKQKQCDDGSYTTRIVFEVSKS